MHSPGKKWPNALKGFDHHLIILKRPEKGPKRVRILTKYAWSPSNTCAGSYYYYSNRSGLSGSRFSAIADWPAPTEAR
jgi:hypothetical protein